MRPIVYVNANIKDFYEDNTLLGRIKDRFRISFLRESFIKELNLNIYQVKLPSNFSKQSYYTNLSIARKKVKNKNTKLAIKTYRQFDYDFFNYFQKDLMAFSVTNSTKIVLRNRHKSIRDSCIVIYDGADDINFPVICYMAKEAKYLVLLSSNITKISSISEYIIANYGMTPIITSDIEYALRAADFIITSREVHLNSGAAMWYLNNKYIPVIGDNTIINDVTYNVPWILDGIDMSPELLGAILCQMEEMDVEKSLKYNGIFLDEIKFNDKRLILG
jgi:hypothetical protein